MDLSIQQRLEALERALAQMVVRGKVVEVDYPTRRAKVRYSKDQVTGWLPFKPLRAGKAIMWWPIEVGEAVTVISPGDLALGEIFPGSYQNDFPAPSDDPDLFLLHFSDDAFISYQRTDKTLVAQLPADGTTTLISKGGITLEGDTQIKGNVTVTGNAHADGDVSDNKSTMQIMRDKYNAHNHSKAVPPPSSNKME